MAAFFVLAVLYGVQRACFETSPRSPWSMAWGFAAAAVLLAVAAWSFRRRAQGLATRRHLGTSQAWLTAHLWGGGAFLLLMLFHTAFRLPSGPITGGLWLLSLWTVASGLLGLLLQRWLPKVLTSGLRVEVHLDRIPELVAQVRQDAEALAAGGSEPVRALYRRRIAPQLQAPRRRLRYFFDITGGIESRLRELRYVRDLLGPEEAERLEGLAALLQRKLEMDAHLTLQGTLRAWMVLHVPTSIVLFAFLALHLFTVFYY
jgi:hypothetical protein